MKKKKLKFHPKLLAELDEVLKSDDPVRLGIERVDDTIYICPPTVYKGFVYTIGEYDGMYMAHAQEVHGLYDADGRFQGMQFNTSPMTEARACGMIILSMIDKVRKLETEGRKVMV